MWIDHGGDITASSLATTMWRVRVGLAHEVEDALVVRQAEVEIDLASGGQCRCGGMVFQTLPVFEDRHAQQQLAGLHRAGTKNL